MTRLSSLRQQNRSVKLINRSHSAMASPGEGLLQINDKKVTMGGGESPQKVMFYPLLAPCPVIPEDINNIVFSIIRATTETLNVDFFL